MIQNDLFLSPVTHYQNIFFDSLKDFIMISLYQMIKDDGKYYFNHFSLARQSLRIHLQNIFCCSYLHIREFLCQPQFNFLYNYCWRIQEKEIMILFFFFFLNFLFPHVYFFIIHKYFIFFIYLFLRLVCVIVRSLATFFLILLRLT